MTKPEITAVREWLDKEGYPLEYAAARELTVAGYRAWRGRYYEDAAEKTYREIDIRADEPDSRGDPWRPIYVLVECKNNSKPWLVLSTDLPLPDQYGE